MRSPMDAQAEILGPRKRPQHNYRALAASGTTGTDDSPVNAKRAKSTPESSSGDEARVEEPTVQPALGDTGADTGPPTQEEAAVEPTAAHMELDNRSVVVGCASSGSVAPIDAIQTIIHPTLPPLPSFVSVASTWMTKGKRMP